MAKTNLQTPPSVLAFERKLDPSDARFSAGNWDQRENAEHWPAVEVREKSVRGTISHRMKTDNEDIAKLNAKKEDANLQRVDAAALPADADTLKVHFTLRVLKGTGTPSACNNADYRTKLLQTVQSYVGNHGFAKLASRYATNIANGRFLWRNRIGGETIEIHVRHMQGGQAISHWRFDALNQPWRSFDENSQGDLAQLGKVIEDGLSGESYVLLDITAFVRVGAGQEVFPSQELILDKGASKKSKTLYTVDKVAAMHSQKIGNALRTIDTWYPGYSHDDDSLGPIAVEPYGSVTSQNEAYRKPGEKQDFYNLLDRWVLMGEAPREEGNQHFVMAVLIRGGVFSKADKKSAEKE